MNSAIDDSKVMDVRDLPCSSKHSMIMARWFDLPVNDYFVLVNGHDPVPLYQQFNAEFPGALQWDYLERGPAGVRIKITKLKETVADRDREWSCPASE